MPRRMPPPSRLSRSAKPVLMSVSPCTPDRVPRSALQHDVSQISERLIMHLFRSPTQNCHCMLSKPCCFISKRTCSINTLPLPHKATLHCLSACGNVGIASKAERASEMLFRKSCVKLPERSIASQGHLGP